MASPELSILGPAVRWHRSSLAEWNALDAHEDDGEGRCPRDRDGRRVPLLAGVAPADDRARHPPGLSRLRPLHGRWSGLAEPPPSRVEPPIFDRQLDYIVGLPLVGIAVLAEVVLPGRIGVMFWVNRLDLLFLPVFVAGATVLLFGVRVAWRQKVALAYLLLGWPWLYTSLLVGTLGRLTSLTVGGLSAALRVFHAATPVAGNAGLFNVVHHGHGILISVVTACSGVDSTVGFLLTGTALAAIVSGSLLRKALWLATGLVVLWLLNLARLLLIFWVARVAGQHLALDVLHPVAGIVMFCLGVGLMSALLRPFGLTWTPAVRSTPRSSSMSPATPRVFAVGAVLVVAAVILSVSDGALRTFDPVAGATGEPKLASFLADPAHPVGWTPTFETEYLANKPLFGQDSRWFRYLYSMTAPGSTSLHSTLPVTADVIDAGNLSGFDAYGVTACYSFHGYTLRDVEAVSLGDGVNGQALSYSGGTAASPQDWSIVYWIWPVETAAGTRYERVILYLQNTAADRISLGAGTTGATQLTSELTGADAAQRRLLTNRAFLVAFAHQVIAGQVHQKDTGVVIDALQTPSSVGGFWTASSSRAAQDAGTAPGSAQAPSTTTSGVDARFWLGYTLRHSMSTTTTGR